MHSCSNKQAVGPAAVQHAGIPPHALYCAYCS